MASTYLHPSNIQFTFRDTEVNEGQTLDVIKAYRNKGLQFTNNINGLSGDAAKRLTDKLYRVANKTAIKSAPFIGHISKNMGTLPVNIDNISNMSELVYRILSLFN